VADALPVLSLARHVHIVTVGDREREDAYPSSGTLVRHLARHGIRAELKILPGDAPVAGSLLSQATSIGADLIVMGGYGHSRFREIVLGGTTRDMLSLMTIPVLMSH
jgi:nucleotide-binding universal stress UspA family protein